MHTNLLSVRAGIDFRDVVETAADESPILAESSLGFEAIRVRGGSVQTLDQVVDELKVQTFTEARLAIDKGFNILVGEDDDICDKSAKRYAERSTFVNLVNSRSAREGELFAKEINDLIDGNILQARDVVFVAEDVELNHQIPVVPRRKGGIVGTSAMAADFVVSDPADESIED